jgi:hypothetical protein
MQPGKGLWRAGRFATPPTGRGRFGSSISHLGRAKLRILRIYTVKTGRPQFDLSFSNFFEEKRGNLNGGIHEYGGIGHLFIPKGRSYILLSSE